MMLFSRTVPKAMTKMVKTTDLLMIHFVQNSIKSSCQNTSNELGLTSAVALKLNQYKQVNLRSHSETLFYLVK